MAHRGAHNNSKELSLAFWLNLIFAVVEIIGGLFTNSTAIIADAFHDLMDAVSIGIAVLLEKFSGKKRTAMFSYGYRRFSLLSALGMSILLLTGAAIMIIGAYNSFLNPVDINSIGMLWLAMLGIAVNGFAFFKLRIGSKEGGSHNHNSNAIMLHLLEDVLGWVAVLVGAIIIYFTGWLWIDGVLAIAIAIFIAYNALRNLISTMRVLLQSVSEDVDINELYGDLRQLEGVKDIHDVHVWTLDGEYNIATVHVVLEAANREDKNDLILKQALRLMESYHIQHPTIQLEKEQTPCKLIDC